MTLERNTKAAAPIAAEEVADAFSVITLDTTAITTAADLRRALVGSMTEIIHELTSAANNRQQRVAIDLRASRRPDATGAKEALIAAARALVQAYVKESGSSIPSVNLVISEADQDHDRQATWRYLSHPDGGMARGATFDLRRRTA